MSGQEIIIANLAINVDRPTDLSFDDLYTWVIWQFPRKRGKWLCGAIRPPIANHQWLPALIDPIECIVKVHGDAKQQFDTPDEALNWLMSAKVG
jgi:hypothetical protein